MAFLQLRTRSDGNITGKRRVESTKQLGNLECNRLAAVNVEARCALLQGAQYVPGSISDLGCRIGLGTQRTAVTDFEREPAKSHLRGSENCQLRECNQCGRYAHDAQLTGRPGAR